MKRVTGEAEFIHWLDRAAAGEQVIYHSGLIPPKSSDPGAAHAARLACERGHVHLKQKRAFAGIHPRGFDYIAERRPRELKGRAA